MSPLRPLRVFLGIVAVLTFASCERPTGPPDGLDVSVALAMDVIRAGEEMDITVTAVNHGTRAVTVHHNGCLGPQGPFVVTSPAGKVVGPRGQICSLAALPGVDVPPGEQFVIHTQWDGTSAEGEVGRAPAFLEPDEYLLRGQIMTSQAMVRSDPVAVTVAE